MRAADSRARTTGLFDDPDASLLDADAWDVPARLTRDACRVQTGADGLRAPRNLPDRDDDR